MHLGRSAVLGMPYDSDLEAFRANSQLPALNKIGFRLKVRLAARDRVSGGPEDAGQAHKRTLEIETSALLDMTHKFSVRPQRLEQPQERFADQQGHFRAAFRQQR